MHSARLNAQPLREQLHPPSERLTGLQAPIISGMSLQQQQRIAYERKQMEKSVLLKDLRETEGRVDVLETENWRMRRGEMVPSMMVDQLSQHMDMQLHEHSLARQQLLSECGQRCVREDTLQNELAAVDVERAGLLSSIHMLHKKVCALHHHCLWSSA